MIAAYEVRHFGRSRRVRLSGRDGCEQSPLWLRYPAISPDGQTLLFEYKGDIWSVPAAGGNAIPLTLSESYEFAPVWSHDGKSVAFASDRYGNFDVFVMPADGGESKRLTYHSTREVPSSFTADDKAVLFNAARQDLATHVQFPTGGMSELYSVPVGRRAGLDRADDAGARCDGELDRRQDHLPRLQGLRERLAEASHLGGDARHLGLRHQGEEVHAAVRRSMARTAIPSSIRTTTTSITCREQSGSFNVYKSSLREPDAIGRRSRDSRKQSRPLPDAREERHAGVLVRRRALHDDAGRPAEKAGGADRRRRPQRDREDPAGQRRHDGGKARARTARSSHSYSAARSSSAASTASSSSASPTRRGRNAPSASAPTAARCCLRRGKGQQLERLYDVADARERAVFLRLDGAEGRSGRRDAGRGIPAGVLAGRQGDRLPREPADAEGLQHRVEAVANRAAARISITRTPTAISTTRGRPTRSGCWCSSLRATGCSLRRSGSSPPMAPSPVRNLTQSGYDDATPKWAMDGKMMIWGTTRDGALSQGGGAISGDVYGMYFTKAAYDRAKLSKEEFALVKEREDKEKKRKPKRRTRRTRRRRKPRTRPRPRNRPPPIAIDWDGLTDRKMRLTINTSAASDWVLSKDGEKLFYLTSFEKGNDLWVTEVRTRETKLFNKLGANSASMELSPDGKFLFVIADGTRGQGRHRERQVGADRRQHGNGPGLLGREGLHLRPQLAPVQTEAGLPRPAEGRLGLLLHDLQEVPAAHQQQLRLRRDAERDARRDERLAHRCVLPRRTCPTRTRPRRSGCSTTTRTPATA